MLEAQAAAAYKRIDELDHNLNSRFMDYDDIWRQNLGPNLYKDVPNNLAVDSTTVNKIGMNTIER